MNASRLLLGVLLTFAISMSFGVAEIAEDELDLPSSGRIEGVHDGCVSMEYGGDATEPLCERDGLDVFVGDVINRESLRPGDVVAVSAFVVPIGDRSGLIGRWFVAASAAMPPNARAAAIERFFPRNSQAKASEPKRMLVSGRFVDLRAGSVIRVRQGASIAEVKLGPEAVGYRIRPGGLWDVKPGQEEILSIRGGTASLLVIRDENVDR